MAVGCSESSTESTQTTAEDRTTTTATVARPATSTSTPSTTGVPPTTDAPDSNSLASGSGCTPDGDILGDGHWFGYVAGAEVGSLQLDLACWFTGDAAAQAATEDGQEPPPNDYYVRDLSDRVRTLSVEGDVEVTWYSSGDPTDEATITYAEWLTGRVVQASETGIAKFPFGVWVTIEGGSVTAIGEQWVP